MNKKRYYQLTLDDLETGDRVDCLISKLSLELAKFSLIGAESELLLKKIKTR